MTGEDAPRGRRGGITTVGTGRVAAVPDTVLVRLAAQVADESAAAAHAGTARAAEALVGALLAAGLERRDVRTASTSSWTDQGEVVTEPGGGTRTRAPRTTVTLGLEARVRDASRAGEVIGAALAAGGEAARLEGTSLLVGEPGPLLVQARTLAFADAVAAARQLAELAGRALGPVVDVRDGAGPVGDGGPRAALAKSALPVEAGEQEVVAQVVVRHAWGDER